MKRAFLLIIITFALCSIAHSQDQQITLEEIWNDTFKTESLEALRSMKNGEEYTVLNMDKATKTSAIEKYDYKTQNKVATLLSSGGASNIPFFTSYEFNDDESKILLATELKPIYRRSKLGIYYVYDVATMQLTKVADSAIQEPVLSPDGSKVAYVTENNLYIVQLDTKDLQQVTKDGKKNKVINGITDWVYEEEFAFVRAFDWNSDGTKIAFLRFDESNVPEFSMDVYGKDLYQTQTVFKYPKAGEDNAKVTLHLYDIKAEQITDVAIGDAYYIPRIKWMNNPERLSIQTLNRHQDDLQLQVVNTTDNKVSLLLQDTDKAYVDVTDNLTFLADDSFIWTSEKDGNNHIYLYDSKGKLINQITKGPWEVSNFYGYDEDKDRVYYQSTQNGSINRDVYSTSSKGIKPKRLTNKEGTNSASFSTDFTYFINTFSNVNTPPYTLYKAEKGAVVTTIKDNESLLQKLKKYELGPKEFSTITINGNDLNMYMIKPKDFDPSKKYPLFMYQYSGPGSQQVANRWMGTNDYWHQMLASQGIVIACVDGRGTGLKGRDFKKVTQKELGKFEVEDQIAAANKLSELPYIDEDRTGIWGWSYGGFMSTNAILKGNDVFEMAIAVAPVTSWRFYDTIYTERYMQTPQENASGYDENSPFNYPELLKGKYLLVHGAADDNVHVQNTMRMVEALVQANKQFDWAIYPDKNHGISGGNTRLHLYTKMTNFIHESFEDTNMKPQTMSGSEKIKG